MNLIDVVTAPFRKAKTIDQIADELEGGMGRNVAGQRVTTNAAKDVVTVLACVDAIATGCAMPPMHVMRDLGDDQKEKAKDVTDYRILNRRPNELQTSFDFRWTLTAHAALTGNGYAIPVYVDGKLRELLPVIPDMVMIDRRGRYEVEYVVHDEFGPIGRFKPDQIFHLKNNSWDRVKGMDAVAKARSAIGLAMAAEDNQARLHENGGRPGGILTTDQKLSAEGIERLKTAWAKVTHGRNAYKTAVLDGGLKYMQMAMSGVDAQSIETRRLQIEEICRAFGVFPQIVGFTDKTATFASAEAFFSAHSRLTVGKWQENWKQRLDEFVLDGSGPLFIEFDNRQMNAAPLKDRGEYYARALGTGGGVPFMTVNEVRAEQGLPPIEGGDELREPNNSTMEAPNAGKA